MAFQDIEKSDTRFRLRKDFILEVMGEDWFNKAEKLGWLNNVGIAARLIAQLDSVKLSRDTVLLFGWLKAYIAKSMVNQGIL